MAKKLPPETPEAAMEKVGLEIVTPSGGVEFAIDCPKSQSGNARFIVMCSFIRHNEPPAPSRKPGDVSGNETSETRKS